MLIPRDDRYDVPWWERGNFSAVPPPTGLTSNFVNPPSKAKSDLGYCDNICVLDNCYSFGSNENVHEIQGVEKSKLG